VLTQEQQQFLDKNGYVRLPKFLSSAEVDEILAGLAEVETKWISEGREKARGIPIKYGKGLDGSKYVNRFAFASMYSDRLRKAMERFKVLAPIFGPDFRFGEDEKDGMVVNHYVNLPGSRYKQLGWHTDGLRDIFLGQKLRPLWQVGVYLDDSPRTKGGLRLIPGTHKQGLASMLFRKAYFVSHDTDPNEICIEAERGDVTIHDGRLWHRVARASVTGEASRRRVAYLPFVEGPYRRKTEDSPTPLYHYLQRITG
jgi:ectoine hydroxylase-related dioxygenase (phytanoyl-CoA dioxygenase family)